MYESDRKAWIRYPPPRWIWQGVAICGIPSDVSRGMLRGWHAHNGVSLGNPRLGFVCTKQTVDAQDSLEGTSTSMIATSSRKSGSGSRPASKLPLFDRPAPHASLLVDGPKSAWPKRSATTHGICPHRSSRLDRLTASEMLRSSVEDQPT